MFVCGITNTTSKTRVLRKYDLWSNDFGTVKVRVLMPTNYERDVFGVFSV